MRKKTANGTGPSEATLNTLKRGKSEAESSMKGFDAEGENSLRTVDHGDDDLFDGDDDDEEQKHLRKRRKREMGQEGDPDENEYSSDPADDDEKIEADGEDEEMKEMEVSNMFAFSTMDDLERVPSGTHQARIQE
jgi:transcription initiation factor TFIIF subunit alpha